MGETRESKKERFLKAYEEYADALFRFSYFRVHQREEAIDLVQTAFMKTWNYIEKGGEIDNIQSFLYTTLRHLIIDTYRDKKKHSSLDKIQEEEEWEPVAEDVHTEELTDAKRAFGLLDHLAPEYREVILMRLASGLSFREIASVMGDTENTVTVRYHRGIKKLRDLFDNGITKGYE